MDASGTGPLSRSWANTCGRNSRRWRDHPQRDAGPPIQGANRNGDIVKFSYYPDTDTLYIDLRYKPGADVLEIADDFVVDVDEDGVPVGMEIEHARQHTNLLHLKVEGPR